jgi:peptidoglycan/LPS O-acetylase OafA/YrhL
LLLDTEIVGVMWTLRVEMLAIPLFILGFFLLRRFGNVALVILLATLLALATWRVWTGLIDPTLGLALLPFFASACWYSAWEKSRGRGSPPAWRRPSSSSPSP